MSFCRFGHLSRKQTSVIERVLQKKLAIDVKTVLESTNGGRFDCEHPIFVKDLNAEIQINVLYGLRKNKRENIYYWNHKYRHQIPENAVIIGDTWNHGFIVYIFSTKKDRGVYYWDAIYDFERSNEVANAYYIAGSMGGMFQIADVDDEDYLSYKLLSVSERFSLWKKSVSMHLSYNKRFREFDADFLQQKRHKSNMFEKFADTDSYNLKCNSRKLIEDFGELVGYEFSEFFKKFAVDNTYKEIKKPYCLSENGLKVCFERLLGLGNSLEIDIWDVNLIEDGETQDLHEFNKEFVIFAKNEKNYIPISKSGNYIAINKSKNYVALLDSEGLFVDKIADNFESFVSLLCDEKEIKRREKQFKVTKKENQSGIEIIDIIFELDDFFFLEQPKSEEVEKAQNDLGLNFAEDYKTYVSMAGAICGGGIELTGITDFERLNVVSVTKKEKALNPLIPDNMYVIEVVGIDRMIVLQDDAGIVYTAHPGLPPQKFFNSLTEYIKAVGRFSPNENARSGFYYKQCDEFGQDLLERIENGLIPILPSGKMVHLHHMGLSNQMPIEISPLVEFESEYYAQPNVSNTLFFGFDGKTNYDRLTSIKQKQEHWNKRSESDKISFNI